MSEKNNRTPSPRRPETAQKKTAPRTGAQAVHAGKGKTASASAVRKTANSTSSAAKTQNARPAARPVQAKKATVKPAGTLKNSLGAASKKTSFLKKAGNILRPAGLVFAILAGAVIAAGKKINAKLNIFRKNEATTIITNCAVLTLIVSLLIIGFLLIKPSMDASRALTLVNQGQVLQAAQIVKDLERKGFDEEKLREIRLIVADKLIDENQFSEAKDMISSMPKDDTTMALSDKYDYHYAQDLYKKGEYNQAAQMFYQMSDYADSMDRYYDCRCALAINSYLDGKEQQIQTLLTEIPDMAERIQRVADDMTGDQDDEMSARIKEELNEEKLKDFEQLVVLFTAAEEDVQNGRIAAGYCHTLGLKQDGTVYAAGDNMYGQSDVSDWSGVVQVAAGAYHSVALLNDGTVKAVGDNSQNQLNVDSWTDIVSVAASGYDTIGLKADGTVVACGMHADLVSGWHGVTMVTGGAYSMGCLYDKGYMMSTHTGAQLDMGVVFFDLAVCGNVSAGILYDGTLMTNVENAPEWTNIVSIEVSSTGIFAIDTNGKVLSYFHRESDNVDFNLPSEAVEIVSSGTHHVVLTKDGKVHSFGSNDFGQLNTNDWSL